MASKPPKTLVAVAAPPPDQPAPVALPIAVAIKALSNGTANEHQQREAMKWILNEACGKKYSSYHGQNHSYTDFALGKAFVAQQIIGLINADLSTLRSGNVPEEVPAEKR